MPRTLSTYLACRARIDLPLDVPRSARFPRQLVPSGELGFVRNKELRRQLTDRERRLVDVVGSDTRFPVKPLRAPQLALGRSVLFVLPSEALGDAVMYAGAIREIAAKFRAEPRGRRLFRQGKRYLRASRSRGDRLSALPSASGHHDVVVDFESDLPALNRVGIEVVTIDSLVLEHLGLGGAYAWTPPRPLRQIRRVGMLPLSTTPLRTFPPALTAFLYAGLAQHSLEVELVLDPRQRQGALYLEALHVLLPDLRPRTDLDSVGALIGLMDGLDYGIFCDSGPAHLHDRGGVDRAGPLHQPRRLAGAIRRSRLQRAMRPGRRDGPPRPVGLWLHGQSRRHPAGAGPASHIARRADPSISARSAGRLRRVAGQGP